jgi:hypothetical protein
MSTVFDEEDEEENRPHDKEFFDEMAKQDWIEMN